MKNMLRRGAGDLFRLALRAILLFPVLPVLYITEPFFRIRLGTMYTQRIGHLALNAETFLRKMQLDGLPPRTLYLFFGWDPANRQLFEMWKRMRSYPVRFFESHWVTRVLFAWRPILEKTRFWEKQWITAVEYHLFNHTEPVLSLTEEEERRGRGLMAEMGVGENDWFVCFHARDGAYYRKWRPDLEEHWQGIDFRNVDIMAYLKAAEYIASRGGYAIRIGAHVEKPLPDNGNPRIIDYSTNFRSDFMDIYLCAKCRFMIGSSSGPIAIPSIFNVPVLSVAHYPFNYAYYRRCDIVVQRLLAEPDSGRLVGFWEAEKADYFTGWTTASSTDQNMHLFRMLEVDEDDILDGCMDMLESLEGEPPSDEAKKLQAYYAERYFSHAEGYEHAAKIGARFAVKYRDLIVESDDCSLTPEAVPS